ncbi:MAG TPA: hypothetical protein VFM55_11040 [Micromonosporaceae bacterium]|nr:hypothetical protein [Micromonosporaceae bacterium]
MQDVRLAAEDLDVAVAERTGGHVDGYQVRFMLQREPATWLGIPGRPSSANWEWDLSRASLRPYVVATGIEYLTALEQLVGLPATAQAVATPFDPLALARALDHLDVVWLAITKNRLLRRRSSAAIASLAVPANSGEEFEARCSALADILSTIDVRSEDTTGVLSKLKGELAGRITDPGENARATSAVDQLRDIVAMRAGQQHSGAAPNAIRAAARLGVRLTGDWEQSWTQVSRIAGHAVYTISDALSTQLP